MSTMQRHILLPVFCYQPWFEFGCLPFSFATVVPEAHWSGDVTRPQGGLIVVTVEHQHHVIGWLERT